MRNKDMEHHRKNPIWGTDFSKHDALLLGEVKEDLLVIRNISCQIQFRLKRMPERLEPIQGLLTCGAVSLQSSEDEVRGFAKKHSPDLIIPTAKTTLSPFDFEKPPSFLIEDLRNLLIHQRGKLDDISRASVWDERIDPISGLLTCGLIFLLIS